MKYVEDDATVADIWLLELAKIPDELRLEEPSLRNTRWFDYRQLLPLQATQTFADTYCEVYKDVYEMVRDYEYAQMVTGNLQESDLVSLWKARQQADKFGMPYDYFIRGCMNQTIDKFWKNIPRPNQITGDEIALDVNDKWQNDKKDKLFLTQTEFYKSFNYAGHPDQDEYHLYLTDYAKQKDQPEFLLARLIFREDCYPIELAVQVFGEECVNRAFKHYNS